MNGQAEQQRFVLLDCRGDAALEFNDSIYVGRSAKGLVEGDQVKIDLIIENGMVSRVHARIEISEQGAYVEDLGSANGTFINDQRAQGKEKLPSGARVRFDVVEYIFEDRLPAADQDTIVNPGAGYKGAIAQPVNKEPLLAGESSEVDTEEDEGVKGGTVVMALRNLPPDWIKPKKGTIWVRPGSKEDRFKPDLAQFAKEVTEPTLFVLQSDDTGIPHKLQASANVCFWNIGRDFVTNDLDIVLDNPSVSGLHAKLVCRDGKWKIADKMSANKVYVDGKPFAQKFLNSGSLIRIGDVQCLFMLPAVSESDGTSVMAGRLTGWVSAGLVATLAAAILFLVW